MNKPTPKNAHEVLPGDTLHHYDAKPKTKYGIALRDYYAGRSKFVVVANLRARGSIGIFETLSLDVETFSHDMAVAVVREGFETNGIEAVIRLS